MTPRCFCIQAENLEKPRTTRFFRCIFIFTLKRNRFNFETLLIYCRTCNAMQADIIKTGFAKSNYCKPTCGLHRVILYHIYMYYIYFLVKVYPFVKL